VADVTHTVPDLPVPLVHDPGTGLPQGPYRSLLSRVERVAFLGLMVAAVLSFVVVAALDFRWHRHDTATASQAWVQALAVQVESAVVFGDSGAAQETLAAAAVYPNVLEVLVTGVGVDGVLAAHPLPSGVNSVTAHLASWPRADRLWSTELPVFGSVVSAGERVGTVHALIDLRPMWRSVVQHALILLATVMLAVMLAGWVTRHLLKKLLAPVSELAEAVQSLAGRNSFSARMPLRAHDEIGLLTQRINQMLAHIEARDALLAANHAQLLELGQRADKANQAKSEFLAHMSHEFRTPLSTIQISSYLALKSGLDDRQRSHVDRIRQAADLLQSLVNDVLDFSKIEAGKVEIDAVPFAWSDVLRQLDTIVGQQARDKGLQFTVGTEGPMPTQLLGDPVRVAQVLMNLAHNAVKFTTTGGVDVHTQVLGQTGVQQWLRVTVTDTGPGISGKQMGQLFQAFHQLGRGTGAAVGGTGLGLVISRQLVTLMGGDIGVTSEPGQGSSFWFTLPLGVLAVPGTPPAVPATEQAQPLLGLTLLLADDNLPYRDGAADLLRHAGAQVVLAGNGEEALAAVAAQGVDAVLMDVQMPVMDGLTAVRHIRSQPRWADLPVIAMTANARVEERDRCLRAGMTDFVAKPFHAPLLFRLIVSLCGAARQAHAGTQPAPVHAPDAIQSPSGRGDTQHDG